MNKNLILLIACALTLSSTQFLMKSYAVPGAFGYDLEKDINRNKNKNKDEMKQQNRQNEERTPAAPISTDLDTKTVYYPKANLKSAVNKYKYGNYTGCLQELFTVIKKDPSNAAAYYYIAMAYTQIGDKDKAIEAYEKVLDLSTNDVLSDYAEKGRDCLTNGPRCHTASPDGSNDALDEFINAPYGNGFSPELNLELKKKQLENIQNTINRKNELENKDIEKIKKFDNSSSTMFYEKIALAGSPTSYGNEFSNDANVSAQTSSSPTGDDVLKAIQVLKDAGMTISVQPNNPVIQMQNEMMNDPRMQEINQMSMMLNGGNNNSNNAMMNMMPYFMAAQNKDTRQNITPQMIQTMMMGNMLNDFNFNNNSNN